MNTSEIYDMAFKDASYNDASPDRIELVGKWIDKNKLKNILDVGCGRGHYMKALKRNITGLEPSTYLCENDLKGMNVYHGEILTFTGKFDGLYAMDVLEHISYEDIDKTLEALSKLAPKAYFGIANHSDKKDGIELHLIQQGPEWWAEQLSKHYTKVKHVHDEPRYFIYEVANV